MPRAIGRLGASACTITSHLLQHSFGRTCRITLKLAGTHSSTSETSSPSLFSSEPHAGQPCAAGICVSTSRGRWLGSGRRTGFLTAATAAAFTGSSLRSNSSSRAALAVSSSSSSNSSALLDGRSSPTCARTASGAGARSSSADVR